MKLKDEFVTQDMDGEKFIIPTENADFSGIAKGNSSAAFILDLLREHTDKDSIVEAMLKKYDAPADVLSADVEEVLNTLRRINALEE